MTDRCKIDGKGWHLYYLEEPGQWVLKYKRPSGRWAPHRVPPKIQNRSDARRHAVAWLDERKTMAREARQAEPPKLRRKGAVEPSMTFGEFAEMWWTGKLAQRFPGYVRSKRSANSDESRLKTHVLPHLKDIPMSEFEGERGLELAEGVMASLPPPKKLSHDSRRQVAQVIHRLMVLAVYPAKILSANPLPKGFLPKSGPSKAMSYLYPAEDDKLMACSKVSLLLRLYYGFLDPEGPRASEARDLQICDVNLAVQAVRLDKNKTDEPRAWKLSPGVAEALRRWLKRYRKGAKPTDLLFQDARGAGPPRTSWRRRCDET